MSYGLSKRPAILSTSRPSPMAFCYFVLGTDSDLSIEPIMAEKSSGPRVILPASHSVFRASRVRLACGRSTTDDRQTFFCLIALALPWQMVSASIIQALPRAVIVLSLFSLQRFPGAGSGNTRNMRNSIVRSSYWCMRLDAPLLHVNVRAGKQSSPKTLFGQ